MWGKGLLHFFWGAIYSASLWASCGTYLTTQFGLNGFQTASFTTDGNLSVWNDGYKTEEGKRIPFFRRTNQKVHLGTSVSSFASLPYTDPDPSYLTMHGEGYLSFMGPDKKVYRINFTEGGQLRTATLYRLPLRSAQKTEAVQGVRLTDPKLFNSKTAEQTQFVDQNLSSYIIMVTDTAVYSVEVRVNAMSPSDDKTADAAKKGMVAHWSRFKKIRMKEPSTITLQPIIDFDKAEKDSMYFIGNGNPQETIVFHSPKKIFDIAQAKEISKSIDYIKVLSPNELILGNELGQIFIVDTKQQKVLHSPSFPKVSWLSELSAFKLGDQYEVWVLNEADHKVYRWQSSSKLNTFIPIAEQLPEGVTPKALSATGELLPIGFSPPEESATGFLSNYTIESNEPVVRRVLVLGSDEKLYAWKLKDSLTEQATFEWVTAPFQENKF